MVLGRLARLAPSDPSLDFWSRSQSSEHHDWIHFDFFSDFFLRFGRNHPLCHQILLVETRSVVGSFLISADFLWIHFPFCGEVLKWEDRRPQKALVLPDKGLDNLGFPLAWDNPDGRWVFCYPFTLYFSQPPDELALSSLALGLHLGPGVLTLWDF